MAGKTADRGTVEGAVVCGLEQELLVVVQHVETAFEAAGAGRRRLDPLFVGQVFDPGLANLARVLAADAVSLGLEIHLLQLVVRDLKKIAQRRVHDSPLRVSRPCMGASHASRAGYRWRINITRYSICVKRIKLNRENLMLRSPDPGSQLEGRVYQ